MRAFLASVRPSLLTRDNLDRAFQGPRRIPSRIAPCTVSTVNGFFHIGIDVLPGGIGNEIPERPFDLLLDERIRRRLDEAVVKMQFIPGLLKSGVQFIGGSREDAFNGPKPSRTPLRRSLETPAQLSRVREQLNRSSGGRGQPGDHRKIERGVRTLGLSGRIP
jgi:hypothetical protein